MKFLVIIFLLSVGFTATTSFASEICNIKIYLYDPASKDVRETGVDDSYGENSWESCYTRALGLAQRYDSTVKVPKTVLRRTRFYNPRQDHSYNPSALVKQGKAEWVNVFTTHVVFYKWSFNDSYLPTKDSKGYVSAYSNPIPAKGDKAINEDESLIIKR